MTNSEQHSTSRIVSSDGARLAAAQAQPAFDYYSMKAGRFVTLSDAEGWALFRHGSAVSLNGERVCSLAHARRMGWL
jgi:hypothetical protein